MKKIIISDFDDTLYFEGQIREQDIESINSFRKKGNLFIVATGSSYTSFNRKNKERIKYDYLITNHGSCIFKKDKLIYNKPLDKNILKQIIKRYNLKNPNQYTTIKDTPGNFFSNATEGLVTPDTKDITKIHLELKNNYKEEVEYLRKTYNKEINLYEIFYNNAIEIVSSSASKLKAIIELIKQENIKGKIYTIGDGNSDIEMIQKYNGYIMKTAKEEIKNKCQNEIESITQLIQKIGSE